MLTEMRKVLSLTQEESLQARERVSVNRTPLVTTFNPHTTFIAEIANRNWNFLQSKERLAHIFQEPPLIAYRRPKSLRDTLVNSKLRNTTTGGNDNIAGGCGPCNKPRCSWCSRINKTSTFTGTQNCQAYHIFHTMDCQSAWVIYVIECRICKLQYVGIERARQVSTYDSTTKQTILKAKLVAVNLQNTFCRTLEHTTSIMRW